jgi:hypothetical protein
MIQAVLGERYRLGERIAGGGMGSGGRRNGPIGPGGRWWRWGRSS